MKYLVFYIVTGMRGEVLYSGSVEHESNVMEPEDIIRFVKERVRDRRGVEVHVTGMLPLDS